MSLYVLPAVAPRRDADAAFLPNNLNSLSCCCCFVWKRTTQPVVIAYLYYEINHRECESLIVKQADSVDRKKQT